MRRRGLARTVLALLATAIVVALNAAGSPAAPGVFSLDRLRLNSAAGPEDYLFTAGNVVFPEGGADSGSFYKFVVTDAAGAVRNGSFPCTSAESFDSTNNAYTIQASDPVSNSQTWKYTLNQYPTSACTGTPTKTASKSFNVAKLTTYADSALTTPKSVFGASAVVYVNVAGMKAALKDWTTTWIVPAGGTSCANTSGSDRADADGFGRFPSTVGGYLQYRPSPTSGGVALWNRESNYETVPCSALGSGNQGTWQLRLEIDATTFVVFNAFTIDTTPPPAPTIASAPSGTVTSTSASIAFSSSEAGVSFLCRLDAASFATCTSPQNYSGLAQGSHTFQVKSQDAAGNESAVSSATWTVDSVAPTTTIAASPSNPSNSATGSFSFSANEAGSSFECALDGPTFSGCTSPLGFSGLADGAHTFQVRATDGAGNTGAPASYTWTVDTSAPPPPTITSSPSDPSTSTSASFSFTSSESGASFQCARDGGAFSSCTSPQTYSGLAQGSHTFQVKATDAAGNTGPAASFSWTIDSIAPSVTVVQPADGSSTADSTPTVSGVAGTSADDSATVTVKIYAGSSATGTPVQTLSAAAGAGGAYSIDAAQLADGTYTVQAEQGDAAGNIGQSAAHTFTVDGAPPPAPAITSSPSNPTASTSASFAFSTGAPGDTYACALDSATFSGCTSPQSYSGLTQGSHTFQVKATDAAGNTGPAASYTWTVDSVSPTVTLVQPGQGATTTAAQPSFSGAAGTAEGDAATVSVKVYAGSSATGTPVQTLSAAVSAGAYTVSASSALADGTYTARAEQADSAGNVGLSAAHTFNVDTTGPTTTITASPGNPSNTSAGSFSFSASEPGSGFECALDGPTFSTCTSPFAYTSLADGSHTFHVRATDGVGNTGPAASSTWTIDTQAPSPTLTEPANGSTTTDSTPTLSGVAGTAHGDAATVTVKIYAGSTATGTAVQALTASVGAGGSYAVDAAPLDSETYTARTEQLDAAGNLGLSSTATFTVTAADTTPPVVTLAQPPNGSITSDNTPTFSGTGGTAATDVPVVTVRIYPGSSATGTPVQTLSAAVSAGAYSVDAATLADGTYTARAEQVDAAGNTGFSAANTFTVDTTPPPAPTITSSPANPSTSTSASFGFSSSDPGATFRCALDTPSFTTCSSPATYSGLGQGSHTFQVTATDPAGNTGPVTSYTWTIDSVAPTVTLTAPANGSTTTDSTPTFSGAGGTAPGDAPTVTVNVYAGTSATGTPVQTLTAGVSAGTYSVDAATLADGTYTARTAQTDSAGNTGLSSANTFTIDTGAPTTTIDSSPSNPGNSASGSFTFSANEPGSTFRCALDSGTFNTCSSPYSYTGLTDGSHTFQVKATDAAGNTGPVASFTWTIDTNAPTVTLAQPANGSTTSDNTPTFSGSAGTAPGDAPTVTVKIYAGSSATGPPVQTLSAGVSGGSYSVDAATLADATYTARTEQTDSAGNTGLSSANTFTVQAVDNTPPAITLTQPTNGSTTADPTPTISGVAGTAFGDSTTVTVKIYAGATATGTPVQTLTTTRAGGGAYSVDAPQLATGQYTARAEQADAAGNVGFSSANTFTVNSGGYRTEVLTDNPAGYWRLGETSGTTAIDEIGANNGSYVGGVTLGVPGALSVDTNTAVSFDGVNDYMTVPDSASLRLTTGATLETWVKRSKSGVWQVIASKPGNGQSKYENYALWFNTLDKVSGFFGDGTSFVRVDSPTALDTNWHYLAVTYDNATAKLYIDGVLKTSVSSTIRLTANTLPLNIGRTNTGTNFLGGQLDEVAVYPAALSATRIQAHFSAGTTFDTTPPTITLTSPANGARTNDTTPTFSGVAGTASGDSTTVTVKVYAGSSATGTPVQTLTTTRDGVGAYSVDASPALAEGTYTAQAEQSDTAGNVGLSSANTFTITSGDTVPPTITLTTPANGSTTGATPPFSGVAGTASGDSTTVTVKIYAGSSATGTPVQTLTTNRDGVGAYSVTSSSLVAGTYTAQAEQSDTAGNVGLSSANTFTVPSGYLAAVLADNPRGYWRLGEAPGTTTARDETGANNGTYSGGVTLGQTGPLVGDSNTAASFNGSTGSITVPDSNSLDLITGATVEAWIKRAKSGAWQVVVSKPGNGSSKFENYSIWINTLDKAVAFFGDGTSFVRVDTPTQLDTNWHYVVATYDNATAKIYVDGLLKASVSSSVRLTANALPLNFGKTNDNLSFFGGQLDDVAVYGAALSDARIAAHYDAAKAGDTTPPTVTLSTPEAGTSTKDTTPAFAGMAGITSRDSATITLRLYSGSSATGTPVQTLSATRWGRGSWDVSAISALADGTYTAQAEQLDLAGNVGLSTESTFTVVSNPASSGDPVVLGAGDIADCTGNGDEATSDLFASFPSATVLTFGDNAYDNGTTQQFNTCYDPSWGRAKTRTRPTLGGHDYLTPNAAGYFGYFQNQLSPFGANATDPLRGYYSYDLGSWHVVHANTECIGVSGCDVNAQVSWLRSDLQAHPSSCTAVITHNPRWSSGSVHGDQSSVQVYWQAMYDNGVDLVLTGDDHDYERFAPQNASGAWDPVAGIREFVVGTGGFSHYLFSAGGVIKAQSEVRNDDTFGLLKLTLHPTGYDWEFLPQAGKTFTDSGTDTCH